MNPLRRAHTTLPQMKLRDQQDSPSLVIINETILIESLITSMGKSIVVIF